MHSHTFEPQLPPLHTWRSGGVHRLNCGVCGGHAVGVAPSAPPAGSAAAARRAAAAAQERWELQQPGVGCQAVGHLLPAATPAAAAAVAAASVADALAAGIVAPRQLPTPLCHYAPTPPYFAHPALLAEEAAANELRQVVIPVIVLGPCGEQLQVAFDDGYLEQQAAADAQAAAACKDCGCDGGASGCDGGASSTAPVPDACGSAPGSPGGSSHNGSSAAASMAGGEVQQPADPPADHHQPAASSSSPPAAAAAAAAAPPSLVQRVVCPVSRSVLSVADVAALYRPQPGC